MRLDYETEAIKLAKAIDIAIESFRKFPPKDWTYDHLDHFVKVYLEWKEDLWQCEKKFKKIASLKYVIADVFTYFQEAEGHTVEYFWEQIEKSNLGYIREDKLRKMLDRGKINGDIEYGIVVDSIVAAEQVNRITQTEVLKLNEMLAAYESKKARKR